MFVIDVSDCIRSPRRIQIAAKIKTPPNFVTSLKSKWQQFDWHVPWSKQFDVSMATVFLQACFSKYISLMFGQYFYEPRSILASP